jgi:hypothetical protein
MGTYEVTVRCGGWEATYHVKATSAGGAKSAAVSMGNAELAAAGHAGWGSCRVVDCRSV